MKRDFKYSRVALTIDMRYFGLYGVQVNMFRYCFISVKVVGLGTYTYVQSLLSNFTIGLCCLCVTFGTYIVSRMFMDLVVFEGGRVGVDGRLYAIPTFNLVGDMYTMERVLYFHGTMLIACGHVSFKFFYFYVTSQ